MIIILYPHEDLAATLLEAKNAIRTDRATTVTVYQQLGDTLLQFVVAEDAHVRGLAAVSATAHANSTLTIALAPNKKE
jgi:hypothetical protein